MAAVLAPSVETRDLRSACKEWKRDKDSAAKWHNGARHLGGVRYLVNDNRCRDVTNEIYPDNIPAKFRPHKTSIYSHDPCHRKAPRKLARMRPCSCVRDSRFHSKKHARDMMRDVDEEDIHPVSVPLTPEERAALNGYPLDYTWFEEGKPNLSTPKPVFTLESFVTKHGRGRRSETERLVEREYEVVDGKGEAVRGKKKVRSMLRREGGKENEKEGKEEEEEEDGFELV
ncbi:hypothetical protein VTK26DRAFT_5230 [Humicola hyalothermophila]